MARGTATVVASGPALPGMPVGLSALTLTVPAPSRWSDRQEAIRALRRARATGITTFDTVDAPEPALAEGLLSLAFPEPDPAIVVLTSWRVESRGLPSPVLTPAAQSGAIAPASLPRDVGGSPARFHRLYEVDATDLPPERPGSDPFGANARSSPPGPLVVRCRREDDVRRAARGAAPPLLSGALSILDARLALSARDAFGPFGFHWVARDPFAGGRLDGSRFLAGAAHGPASSPRAVRELEADFASVAPLRFLARPRTRTLAQAAVRYVAEFPWVATVVIPLPAPERWEETVGYAASPPLDPEERARAEALALPLSPGPGDGRGGR